MTNVHLTLSGHLEEFVNAQVSADGHASPSEYILALLQERQKKKEAWKKVEALVLDGLDSGDPVVADQAFWDDMHRSLIEKYPEAEAP